MSMTSLMIASNFGHIEMIKFLIDNGANINLSDKNKFTALLYAVAAG